MDRDANGVGATEDCRLCISDVDYACPRWRKCSELQSAWSKLELVRVDSD
jgi:hypothetical protein